MISTSMELMLISADAGLLIDAALTLIVAISWYDQREAQRTARCRLATV